MTTGRINQVAILRGGRNCEPGNAQLQRDAPSGRPKAAERFGKREAGRKSDRPRRRPRREPLQGDPRPESATKLPPPSSPEGGPPQTSRAASKWPTQLAAAYAIQERDARRRSRRVGRRLTAAACPRLACGQVGPSANCPRKSIVDRQLGLPVRKVLPADLRRKS